MELFKNPNMGRKIYQESMFWTKNPRFMQRPQGLFSALPGGEGVEEAREKAGERGCLQSVCLGIKSQVLATLIAQQHYRELLKSSIPSSVLARIWLLKL